MPVEILEIIVLLLDISSALSFIQVNRHVNKAFENNKRFWMTVTKYIGIETNERDSADILKKRFRDWKTGRLSNFVSIVVLDTLIRCCFRYSGYVNTWIF